MKVVHVGKKRQVPPVTDSIHEIRKELKLLVTLGAQAK